jgi:plastocyanin
MKLGRFVALSALAAAAACSSSAATGTTRTPPPGATVITIQDFTFSPASVTIKAGQTVFWSNNGPSAHTTTSDTGVWDSGTLSPGSTFQMTFNTPGSYSFHCTIHPPAIYPGFTGTITVTQ